MYALSKIEQHNPIGSGGTLRYPVDRVRRMSPAINSDRDARCTMPAASTVTPLRTHASWCSLRAAKPSGSRTSRLEVQPDAP